MVRVLLRALRVSKVQRSLPPPKATGTAKCVQHSLSLSPDVSMETRRSPVTVEHSLMFSPSGRESLCGHLKGDMSWCITLGPLRDRYPGYILQSTVMRLGSSSWVLIIAADWWLMTHYKAWWWELLRDIRCCSSSVSLSTPGLNVARCLCRVWGCLWIIMNK